MPRIDCLQCENTCICPVHPQKGKQEKTAVVGCQASRARLSNKAVLLPLSLLAEEHQTIVESMIDRTFALEAFQRTQNVVIRVPTS